MVELALDGVPYAHSSGGNHHVFRVTATPGDHTLLLKTPCGNKEITVHVTDEPPVRFEPFDRTAELIEKVDALKLALYDFMQTSPAFSFSNDANTYGFQKIFLTDEGAFILFGAMKERYLWACEVRYIDLSGTRPTAGDIAAAPAIFTWDAATRQRPVKLTAVETGGDRLYLVIVDDEALTVHSIFPHSAAPRTDIPLTSIAPELGESIAATLIPMIRTKGYRESLFVSLDTYGTGGVSGHFEILVTGPEAKRVDLDGHHVDGISPRGHLIAFNPAPFVGPFETNLADGESLTKACFPLPEMGNTFSFTGGSVHQTDEFYPEHPRFEIAPLVGCVGCTKDYVPPHDGIAGDVTFGPDILRSWIAGREGYFRMTPSR
jgi:hypothetical protein